MKPKKISTLIWLQYLIELLVIIAGILGAFALENWNEKRQEKQLIREVMLEIAENLEYNLFDLRPDSEIHYQGYLSNIKVQNYLASDTTYHPNMCFDFHFLQKEEYSYPNKTGFDRLKGLDVKVLEQDSFVEQITRIYDYYFPRISKGQSLYPDIRDYFHPFYQANFESNEDPNLEYDFVITGDTIHYPFIYEVEGWGVVQTIGYVPKDFDALKNDAAFRSLLKETLEFRVFKYSRYQQLINSSEDLIQQIRTKYGE